MVWQCSLSTLIYIMCLFPVSMIAQEKSSANDFRQLLDNYYEERMTLYPLEATGAGDNRYNDRLPNMASEEFRNQTHEFYSKYKNLLKDLDRLALKANDRISYDILLEVVQRELEGEGLQREYIPFAQFFSLPLSMGQLGSGTSIQPFKSVNDYENWLKRIDAFTPYVDTAIEYFNRASGQEWCCQKRLLLK